MSKLLNSKVIVMILAIVLSVSAVTGGTIAWFTDEVTSETNIIKAGNLDIEAKYWDEVKNDWFEIEKDTEIFDNDFLWEPGAVQYRNLTIENVGNLDFEYRVNMNVGEHNEISSTDDAGNPVKYNLTQVLKYGLVEGGIDSKDRQLAISKVTEWTKLEDIAEFGEYVPLTVEEGKDLIGLVIYWEPSNDDNNWNVNNGKEVTNPRDNKNELYVDLGITFEAKQMVSEEDSFGNDYDANAGLPMADVSKDDTTNITATWGMGGPGEPMTLDTAFIFKTTETADEAEKSEQRYWHADFVVSADKDVPANSLALAGYYAAYCDDYNNKNWVALRSDQEISANTEIRLLAAMMQGGSINYEELCKYVPEFKCGATDLTGDNTGTTLRVELRLYETEEPSEENGNSKNIETGEYKTLGVYTHTFGNTRLPEAKVTKEGAATVPATFGTNNPSSASPMKLDTSFTFEAVDDVLAAKKSIYRYWHADFVVSANRDVEAETMALAGYYEAYCKDYNGDNWVALKSDKEIPANTEIRLISTMMNGVSVNYEELCDWVKVFKCGAADLSANGENTGTTLNVELRLYETEKPSAANNNSHNIETGNYVVVGTYTYTF